MSNKTNWQLTENRFIVFLDIMGFKDLVMRKTHTSVYEMLYEISKVRKEIEDTIDRLENDKYYQDAEVTSVSFSDSIILISKTDTIACFDLITFASSYLFRKAIEKNIPLKGAMAYGQISVNKTKQIYFGQALIDAYLLEEEIQYYGITAHHTIVEFIEKNKDTISTMHLFKECITPLKIGMITHANLNWFDGLIDNDFQEQREEAFNDKIKIFRSKTSGAPSKYIDNTMFVFKEIYKTTNKV